MRRHSHFLICICFAITIPISIFNNACFIFWMMPKNTDALKIQQLHQCSIWEKSAIIMAEPKNITRGYFMKNYNTIFEKGQHKILACVESENVNIKCERFFDFFRFSIMHKRWSCFLVHYSHICYYIAASSFSNSSLLLQQPSVRRGYSLIQPSICAISSSVLSSKSVPFGMCRRIILF